MMNPLIKLKYIKELKGHLKQDLMGLPVLEKLATIKRMRELIQLLGGTANALKEAVAKAQSAEELANLMMKALEENKDVLNAYKRSDMDSAIDLKIGNGKFGLEHIVKRRAEDGTLSIISEKEMFEAIALALIEGSVKKIRGSDSDQALEVTKGETSAILIKEEGTNAWMLTGWTISKEKLSELEKLPPDERRSALFNSAPTHVSPTTSRTNVGAGGFDDNSTDDETINQESDVVFLQQVIQGKVGPTDRAMSRMNVIIHNTESTDEEKKLQDKALDVWFKALVSFVVGEKEEIE